MAVAGWMLSHHAPQRADSLSSTRGCGFPGSCRWEITDRFVDYTNIDLHLLRILCVQPSRELKKASNLFCWNLNLPLFSSFFSSTFYFSLFSNLIFVSFFPRLYIYIWAQMLLPEMFPSCTFLLPFCYLVSWTSLWQCCSQPVNFLTTFIADTKSSPLKIVLADDRWQLGLLILSTSKRNIQQIYKYEMYQYSVSLPFNLFFACYFMLTSIYKRFLQNYFNIRLNFFTIRSFTVF